MMGKTCRFLGDSAIVLVGLVLICSGCEQREQQSCRMADEYVVARTVAAPNALDVLRIDSQKIAVFWSADKSSYYAVIDNQGIPIVKAMRLEARDTGAPVAKTFWDDAKDYMLDAVSISATRLSSGKVAVALLCHQRNNSMAVFSVFLNVKRHGVERIQKIGTSGLYARQVSQVEVGNRLLIGWPDTTVHPQRVQIAVLNSANGKVLSTAPIESKSAVFGPAIQTNQEVAMVLWSTVEGSAVHLFAAKISKNGTRGKASLVDNLQIFDPDAHVVPFEDGFAAVYRDNRDEDQTEEFYLTVLSKDAVPIRAGKRISRADGPVGPKLSVGDQYLFSTAVRSYNNNYLVGFNRFDKFGTKTGGEFQLYADKCDFIRAGMATTKDEVILVYAENADAGGRILASTIGCDKKNP